MLPKIVPLRQHLAVLKDQMIAEGSNGSPPSQSKLIRDGPGEDSPVGHQHHEDENEDGDEGEGGVEY